MILATLGLRGASLNLEETPSRVARIARPASHAYRKRVGRLKGVGAKVIILEEASRLDEAVFTEVIVPLLNVRDTAMLAISTPLDENNFYSTLLNMKDPVTRGPMFNVLEIKLICDVCSAKGVKDVCVHRRELIPPWKNDHRRESMTKALFESQPRMYMQEQLGISSSTDARCFDVASVDDFGNSSSHLEGDPKHAFVGIDTCGGGSNFMALVSGVYSRDGVLQILAVDTSPITSDAQLEAEVASHAERLRAIIPRTTPLVSIIEANYGGWVQASRVASLMRPYKPVVHISCDRTSRHVKRPGVYTTWETKERMRHELQRLLRERRIRLSHQIRCARTADVQELVKQLKRFEYIYKSSSSSAVSERKRMISGKVHGQNDDAAIALMLLAYWSSYYINSDGKTITNDLVKAFDADTPSPSPLRRIGTRSLDAKMSNDGSADSMWPKDDECDSVDNDGSDSSFRLEQTAPKRKRAAYSPVTRSDTRIEKVSVASTLEALQAWRTHMQEPEHSEIPTTAQACREMMRRLTSVRCNVHLANITALVDAILKEASMDSTLSKDLRASVSLLSCFVHVDVEERSDIDGGRSWNVRMKASVDDTRRYRPLQHVACSATFAEARTKCSEDDLLKLAATDATVCVALVRRKGYEHLSIGDLDSLSVDEASVTVASLGKHVAILLYDNLPSQIEILLDSERQLSLYAMLHSVARWMDTSDLMKRSDEDFLATLAYLTQRYPNSLNVFASSDSSKAIV
ncbi:hypothetical protein CYMTET_35733 [Cymbomonas tetramitiformis]|uniref:Uncharacterized protein n=1 Tax=Cymbomonas tetramitiformis TaxID=36881 RepID=A0AAE0KNG7_9CHLO|nr:hypothetical protein CYMTET_35733 [Cymbomonas tetramitiformis]